MDRPRSAQYLQHLGLPEAPDAAGPLERALAQALADARQAWPGIVVAEDAFVRHLARHAQDRADPARDVASLDAGDLYLACGCAAQDPGALAAFERLLAQVPPALARFSPSPAFLDEVLQTLRTKLLVPRDPAEQPRVLDYAGRGSLLGWLRVAAVRAALDLRRNQDDRLDGGIERLEDRPARPSSDPEIDYLRGRYAAEFQEAVRAALGTLEADQRTVLRLRFVDGLTIDQVAAALRVGRATATRWIAAAREAIFTETQRLLRERIGLSDSEFGSLAAVLRSGLDVSLSRALGGEAAPRSE
jgi:RNA polymerase sigma-70 factor, ECF subfamily